MSPTSTLRPICRPLHTGIFQSTAYRCLPDDGTARLLLFCSLVHPHGGTFHLPGLYNVGREALREVVGLPKKAFLKALEQLKVCGLVVEDESSRLFWLSVALTLVGPPQNPNVVKGYVRSLAQLTPSPLIEQAARAYISFLKPFGPNFVEPFRNGFETIAEGLGALQKDPSGRVAEVSLHIDTNRDKNLNHHHHNTPFEVTSERVIKFAEDSGWPLVPESRLRAWLGRVPNLCWDEFELWGNEVKSRDEVKDPLPYLFGLLRKRPVCSQDAPAQMEQFGHMPDGSDIAFDD